MPSKLTRRRLLGGLAGGSAAGFAGYRLLPANLLPASVLQIRTERRSIPEVDTSLSVSPDALDDSREHLQAVIDRAEAAWDGVEDSDVDSDSEEFDRNLESSLDTAREKLDEAEGAALTTDALQTLRFGVDRAAWSLAAARAITEDHDAEELRERSRSLYRDANDFAESMSYEVADPRRAIAYFYRTERAVHFARLKSYGQVYVSGEEVGESEYSHRNAVEAIRGAIAGRRWLGDAEAIYEAHRSKVAEAGAGETTDLESHLDGAWKQISDRIEAEFPDRETAIERRAERNEEGARGWATRKLLNNGLFQAYDAYPPSHGLRSGLLAYVAVEHAKALQHGLGYRSAMERFERTFSDGEVDAAKVDRTKRQAVSRLAGLLADADDPFTRELAARPREEIAIGDWPLGVNSHSDSEYPRAEAYAMYLLAAENLAHTPEVRDALLP